MRGFYQILFSSDYTKGEKFKLFHRYYDLAPALYEHVKLYDHQAKTSPDAGCTGVLHIAAKANKTEFFKKVVEVEKQKDLDINYQDKNGWTALHIAAALGNKDIVKILKDNSADFSIKTKVGEYTAEGIYKLFNETQRVSSKDTNTFDPNFFDFGSFDSPVKHNPYNDVLGETETHLDMV